MSDRELLEKAAKAIGLDLCFNDAETPGYYSDWRGMPQWEVWNPLVHDGDALRLAVRLDMIDGHTWKAPIFGAIFDECGGNWYAATRRAIVRAAAAITEQKEGGGNADQA